MNPPSAPEDELGRIRALRAYGILDTPPESQFDDLVALAAEICGAPVALVSLVDKDRQWFKAEYGAGIRETPREYSFCVHTIRQEGVLEIADLSADVRFVSNPFVVNEPKVRFYAGAPLVTPEGHALGTLCVLDRVPRSLTNSQRNALSVLANQVMAQLELRRKVRELAAQRESEQAAMEVAEVATWRWNLSDDEVAGSSRLHRLVGFDPNAGERGPIEAYLESVHPEDVAYVRSELEGARDSGKRLEFQCRLRAADGSYRWILARGSSEHNERGELIAFSGVVIDITDQVRVNRELALERQQFRTLLDEVPAHVVTLRGHDLHYDFGNRAFLKFIGRDEISGLALQEAWPVPDDHVALLQSVMSSGQGFQGKEVPVPIPAAEDPDQVGYFDFIFQPLLNSDGVADGVFIHSLDVTEKVRARNRLAESEERLLRLNEELEERVAHRTAELVTKNQELEGFTYSVSHDMRTPLRAIISNARIVVEEEGERVSPGGRVRLERLETNSLRMAQLVDDLLQHARLGTRELRRESVDLGELAIVTARELQAECPDLLLTVDEDAVLRVECDPRLIGLALQNLFDNAYKYRKAGQAANVRLSVEIRDDQRVFVVSDDGIGFDMRYVSKLFVPFERLHRDEYAGTGIGLANVRRAIERHGGRVWAEGEVGVGAAFYFTLSQA